MVDSRPPTNSNGSETDEPNSGVALIDDLLTPTREGKAVSEAESVELADLVETCWQNVVTREATLVVTAERTLRTDRSRPSIRAISE